MSSSTGNPKRTRSDRVATLKLPPGTIERAWNTLWRGDVILRLSLCFVTALAAWIITGFWNPPFEYRLGDVSTRNVVSRVSFEIIDPQKTELAREEARRLQHCVYDHDPRPLLELQQALKDKIFQLVGADSYEDVDKDLWSEFLTEPPTEEENTVTQNELNEVGSLISSLATQGAGPPIDLAPGQPITTEYRKRAEFERFKKSLEDDPNLEKFVEGVSRSLAEFEKTGLLDKLGHSLSEGNQSQIQIRDSNNGFQVTPVDDVRIGQALPRIKDKLQANLISSELANQVFSWLRPNIKSTLTYNPDKTREWIDDIVAKMPPETDQYTSNESVLAKAGVILDAKTVALLREEHNQFINDLDSRRLFFFSLSKFGMYLAIYTLCGFYIYFRHRPLLTDISSLAKLLSLILLTVTVSWFAAPSRFELIPLLLFSMTMVILYKQELALLLSTSVALVTVLSLGYGVMELVTVLASMATAVLLLRHIRSRTKLIYVAVLTAVGTFMTSIGVGTMSHFIDIANTVTTTPEVAPPVDLFLDSMWLASCAVAAGLLLTGLLPFIERFFDVQTDLSLLELGDPAHPLLQELVRRAPGTYNHSINVASIAQAAAESIGANGLLVRVGAYFHDIGKMLKPGYFVENQLGKDNCHESLLPAMSTLVIIAHVKDGADLARQHNLPDSIIDFIQQHHGTTLVEYFYRRANEQKESDPEAAAVDEGSYRYPGPKPQTREAAVLMLADAVESAARTLVEPAPARIESLVEEISMKRLLDGQFDECGLTLRELRTIQQSLMKSLAAVYHGRIKYQDQQTA